MNTFSWKSIQKTLRPASHFALKTASKLDQYICDRLQSTILDICETMNINSAVHESTQIPPAVTSPSILPWVPVVRVTWNNWVSAVCHSPPSHESERTNTLLTFVGSFNPKCSIIVRLSHLTKFGSWSSRAPLGLLSGSSRAPAGRGEHHCLFIRTIESEPFAFSTEQSSLITGPSSLPLSHPAGTDSTFDFNLSRNQRQWLWLKPILLFKASSAQCNTGFNRWWVLTAGEIRCSVWMVIVRGEISLSDEAKRGSYYDKTC